jgi:DNA primase
MSDAANDPYKRATLITDIVKSISVIPEAIVRSEYVKECSQMLHVEERILVNEISKMKREEEERKAKKEERRTPDTPIEIKEGEASTPSYHQADAPNSDVPLPPYDDMPPADPTLHMGAIGANHPEYTPAPTLGENRDTSLLYAKERLIIQQVIRHGESIVYEDEQTGSQYTVGTYIAEELGRDEIALQTPIFAQILNETILHQSDQNFTAERYFINHPDPAISKLAVDLAEEKYQLSKYHSKTQTIVGEADRLLELISHLMIDYKHSLIEQELKDILNQLRQPEIMADPEKCLKVMSHYKELMEIKQQMAKHLGDRVIG